MAVDAETARRVAQLAALDVDDADALAAELQHLADFGATLPPVPDGLAVPDVRDALPDRRRDAAPVAPPADALRADAPAVDADGRIVTGGTRDEP